MNVIEHFFFTIQKIQGKKYKRQPKFQTNNIKKNKVARMFGNAYLNEQILTKLSMITTRTRTRTLKAN